MKHRLLILILALFSLNIMAQEKVDIKKKEFKRTDQTEGFKEAWKSIKEGDEYYEEGIGTFNLARDHYLFANQYNAFNPELNYKIGICYLFGDEKKEALEYLLTAYELKPEVSHEITLLLGRAYHQNMEFDKAKEFYVKYKSSLPLDEGLVNLHDRMEKLIVECTNGKQFLQNPERVIIQNLGENVNSMYDDYNPKFSMGDTALFFTSRRPAGKKPKRAKVDNKFFEDIYISTVSNYEFGEARLLDKPFNTSGNDALVAVGPEDGSLFIYRGAEDGGDIEQTFFSDKKGKWKKPVSLSKYIGTDAEETTAALSPSGNELYFVSSNPEETIGGKDIFVTKKNAKGKWDDPVNLGALINSKYDEEGVYLTNDGNTMYYASRGHNSMGGYDVFMTTKKENGLWEAPINLGYPINSAEDEVFYVMDASGTYGFFSAIRDNGLGGKDIYKVIRLGSEKELVTMLDQDLIAGIDYMQKDPFLTLPEKVIEDTTLLFTGYVKDTLGGIDSMLLASLSFMDPATGQIAARGMTGSDGLFRARLPEAKYYGVEINATGYLYFLDIVDLTGLTPDEPMQKNFYLQKIEVGTKVVLDNIYFETGKSVLTVSSYDALNQVTRFLQNNNSVRLEISGHTDNTGSLRVNTRLSAERAQAVVDYIVGQGVAPERLESKGYADSQPVASNDTPEGREQNRRVEFKVLSK